MARFSDPKPLIKGHQVDEFNCGVAPLNVWLLRYARQAAMSGSARTYVVEDAQQTRVVGYYALTVASIEHEDATARVAKSMPRYPVPVVVLARLAVDTSVQRLGLGSWLLRDAMLRTVTAADELGIRAMLAHAYDENARSFYLRWGFEESPTDPLNVQILVKDIRNGINHLEH